MTPVIAFDCGSLRELIEHNVSGFIVPPLNEYRQPNIQGLVDAIKRIDQIEPKDCFDRVKRKFTADIMVENYLNIYRELEDKKMEL
jgi:glycosyltransferase involved in cell wall biosynthesis